MATRIVTEYKDEVRDSTFDELPDLITGLLLACNDQLKEYKFTQQSSPADVVETTNPHNPAWVLNRTRIVTLAPKDDEENPIFAFKFCKLVENGTYWLIKWYISNDYTTADTPSWYEFGAMKKYGYGSSGDMIRYEAVVTSKNDIIVYGKSAKQSGAVISSEVMIPIFALTSFSKVEESTVTTSPGFILFGGHSTPTANNSVSYISSIIYAASTDNTIAPACGGTHIIQKDSDLSSVKSLNMFPGTGNLTTGCYWKYTKHSNSQASLNWNVKRPVYTNANSEAPSLTILSLLYSFDAPYVGTTTRMIEFSRIDYTDGLYQFSGHKYYVTWGLAFLDE